MLKSLLAIGSLQFLTMLVLLARTKGLALLLGPEQLGLMGVIDRLLAVVTQTAGLSLPFAAVRFLPARWEEGRESYDDLLGRMLRLLLLLLIPVTAACLLLARLRPGIWGHELLPYTDILTMAFLTIPALALVPFLQNTIAGRLQHNRAMLFSLGHAFLMMTAALGGVWWMGLKGFYLLYAIGGSALAWSVTRNLRRRQAAGSWRQLLRVGLPARVWRFCLYLMALTFASPFAALFVSYSMLSAYGAVTVGWMQAAVGISLSVRAVLGSAHPVFLTPHVNRDASPESRMHWANEYQKTLAFLAAVTVPPLLFFPDIIIRLLYSSEFVSAAPFISLFVAVEILGLLAGTYQAIIIAQDRMVFHVGQNVAAQALLIGAAFLLIPRFGIGGAAVAALASQMALYAGTTLFLRTQYGLSVPARTFLLYLVLVAALAASGSAGILMPGMGLSQLSLKAAIYGAIVMALALLLTRQDRINLRRILRLST